MGLTGVPAHEDCVLANLIDRHAAARPDAVFAHTADGAQITYAQLRRDVRVTAAALQALGVAQGDHVLCWLPTGYDALRVWFAINYLGAVHMPINLEYRGALLAHAIELSDARLAICDAGLLPRFADVGLGKLEMVVALGELPDVSLPIRVASADALVGSEDDLREPAARIEPWHTQNILMTSGTTGPSKAVLSSYAHLYAFCGPDGWPYMRDDDRTLLTLPVFHMGGIAFTYSMLLRGASVALMGRFRTSDFWLTIEASRSTVAPLMGAMTSFLLSEPPSDIDRRHGLRLAVVAPILGNAVDFAERFGVELFTVYNMTETSTPLISDRYPTQAGVCGRPRAGVDVRLVDENDVEVPDGSVGELIVRTHQPWAMNHGYYKAPEATAKAWRNGWFHTGDSFRKDPATGLFFFVDRKQDVIRRRGENISSFEVEREVGAHPAVKEAVAIAVPSELGEDELMVVVVPEAGHEIDPREFFAFLAERMPRFMVPRYLRVVSDLPRTAAAKIQKHVLRSEGIGEDAVDRESLGIRLARQTLATA